MILETKFWGDPAGRPIFQEVRLAENTDDNDLCKIYLIDLL